MRPRAAQGTYEPRLTIVLILINVIAFAAERGGDITTRAFQQGALYGQAVANGDWWRVITSGFLHANIAHILFNMFSLWWVGSALERYVGPLRLGIIYFLSLLGGSAGALLISPNALTVGASGAIFGLVGALLVLERQGLQLIGPVLPILVLNLVCAFREPGDLEGRPRRRPRGRDPDRARAQAVRPRAHRPRPVGARRAREHRRDRRPGGRRHRRGRGLMRLSIRRMARSGERRRDAPADTSHVGSGVEGGQQPGVSSAGRTAVRASSRTRAATCSRHVLRLAKACIADPDEQVGPRPTREELTRELATWQCRRRAACSSPAIARRGEVAGVDCYRDTRMCLLNGPIVSPQCRGQGVGASLLRIALRAARWNGMGEIWASSGRGNRRAERIAEAEGFRKGETNAVYRLERVNHRPLAGGEAVRLAGRPAIARRSRWARPACRRRSCPSRRSSPL